MAGHSFQWIGSTGGAWGVSSNWQDLTAGTVAVAAPGAGDAASITNGSIVTGSGTSASLTMTGGTLSGTFSTGAFSGAATLALGATLNASTVLTNSLIVSAGATLTASSVTLTGSNSARLGNGIPTLYAFGANASIKVSGTVTYTPTAGANSQDLSAANGGTIQVGGLQLGPYGLVDVDSSSSVEVGTSGNARLGALTIDAGQTVSPMAGAYSTGAISSNYIVDNGTLDLSGYVAVLPALTGTTTVAVESNTTAIVKSVTADSSITFALRGDKTVFSYSGSLYSSDAIVITGSTETLQFQGPSVIAAPITGFTVGDTLNFAVSSTPITSTKYTTTAAGQGTLSFLSASGQVLGNVTLLGDYIAYAFTATTTQQVGTISTITVALSGVGATVSQLFQSILGRAADAAGLDTWVNAINGGNTSTQVGAALAGSVEARGDINGLYQAVLGRAGDGAGLNNLQTYLASTQSLSAVRGVLAVSAEAQGDIAGLYQAVLGRPADAGGLASFTQMLASGSSLGDVRTALATSAEGQAALNGLYQALLGRAGDTAGLAAQTQYLQSGGTLASVRSTMVGSAEGQAAIANTYQAALNRTPDPSGSNSSIAYLRGSGSLSGLASLLATSGEGQADINTLYQTILGRAVDAGGLASSTAAIASGGSLAMLANTLATSAESQANIAAQYQAILGRAADAAGLANYTQYLLAGGSLAGIAGALANSGEAQSDVAALYQAVLGRNPDAAGLTGAIQFLAGGGSLASLRLSLATSTEAQADLTNLYPAVLGRAADAGGIATFTQQLKTNGTLANVRTTLANSAEGVAKTTTVLASAEGRTPTATEIAGGTTQLGFGLSLSDLTAQTLNLAGSPNFIFGANFTDTTLTATVKTDVFVLAGDPVYLSASKFTIVGFDTAHDILELPTPTSDPATIGRSYATVASIFSHATASNGGTLITLGSNQASFFLQGVSPGNLVPADFRVYP